MHHINFAIYLLESMRRIYIRITENTSNEHNNECGNETENTQTNKEESRL